MLRAIALALSQLFTGPILGVLGACAMLSIACFVGIWFGLDWLFAWWLGGDDHEGLATILGSLTTLILAWFLFPLVASAFVAAFLDKVADLVERRHYPELPKAVGLSVAQSVFVAVRFLVVLIGANVLLLLLLFFPPVYAVAAVVVNGWLVGREYLELVAMRRLSRTEADALRRRHGTECFLTGVVLALLLAVPFVNLVLPVVGTAVMVHRYHDWQRHDGSRADDYSPDGG